MEIFNIIVGTCSIISLFVSLFVANKVINISKIQNNSFKDASNTKVNQSAKGNNNRLAGRDNHQ